VRRTVPSSYRLTPTQGTFRKAGLHASALVEVLRGDLRVDEAERRWRVAHRLDRGLYANLARLRDAVLRDQDRDLARLHQLVAEELHLPYGWLGHLLLMDFRLGILREWAKIVHVPYSDHLLTLEITPADVGLPRGRRPKNGGKYIKRDVTWYYRAEIKHPRDTVYRLAQEYAAGWRSEAHKTVDAAITRVKALLAVFELAYPPPDLPATTVADRRR
jgi:hypothetical protein